MEQMNNGMNNNGSGDNSNSPNPNRAAMGFNDPASGFNGQMQMNPMAMMAQYQGMMGNMPNQDMMSMMGSYCQSTGTNGNAGAGGGNVGSFASFPSNEGGMMMMGPQGMNMNPQAAAMAQMQMMRKRNMDPSEGGMGMCAGMAPQSMNAELMTQMMRNNKRSVDGLDEEQGSPAAKRPNFGQADSGMPSHDGAEARGAAARNSDATATGHTDDDVDEKPSASNSPAPQVANNPPKQHAPIMASEEGIKFYSRNDVLCGRGGGTNVHPGNRRFRDLINANRRAYLKARKNDKPAISRSIVRTIREMDGRFLKKDEKKGLWFEIGDDGAREKTSQALRQRAPEMRKILFDDEQRHQQVQQQEMMMQRQQIMGMQGMGGGMGGMGMQGMGGGMGGMGMGMNPGMANASMMAGMGNQQGGQGGNNSDPISQSLLAKYNMLHQKNWLAQEKNMILQRLAMSGINPQSLNNAQNNIDSMTSQTLLNQGMKPVTPRGA